MTVISLHHQPAYGRAVETEKLIVAAIQFSRKHQLRPLKGSAAPLQHQPTKKNTHPFFFLSPLVKPLEWCHTWMQPKLSGIWFATFKAQTHRRWVFTSHMSFFSFSKLFASKSRWSHTWPNLRRHALFYSNSLWKRASWAIASISTKWLLAPKMIDKQKKEMKTEMTES